MRHERKILSEHSLAHKWMVSRTISEMRLKRLTCEQKHCPQRLNIVVASPDHLLRLQSSNHCLHTVHLVLPCFSACPWRAFLFRSAMLQQFSPCFENPDGSPRSAQCFNACPFLENPNGSSSSLPFHTYLHSPNTNVSAYMLPLFFPWLVLTLSARFPFVENQAHGV